MTDIAERLIYTVIIAAKSDKCMMPGTEWDGKQQLPCGKPAVGCGEQEVGKGKYAYTPMCQRHKDMMIGLSERYGTSPMVW